MVPPLASQYLDLRRVMEDRGIHLCYSGVLTEDILTSIGKSLRRKMELDGIDSRVIWKIFSTFVEQVQNVIRYSAQVRYGQSTSGNDGGERTEFSNGDVDLRYGSLTVGTRADGVHFVSCSNLILQSDVARISGLIEEVRGLDRGAIASRMRDILKRDTLEGSKGAGIGFLTIAKNATAGFDFDFVPVDSGEEPDHKALFTFYAYI